VFASLRDHFLNTHTYALNIPHDLLIRESQRDDTFCGECGIACGVIRACLIGFEMRLAITFDGESHCWSVEIEDV